MNPRHVDGSVLVHAIADRLKGKIEMPEWAKYVKTGSHVERPPLQDDWWYIRAASILRKVYMDGPVGVERLRTFYGKKKNFGHRPSHFRKAGGKIIRTILQQLEALGYVKQAEGKKKGRVITDEGKKFVDGVAKGL